MPQVGAPTTTGASVKQRNFDLKTDEFVLCRADCHDPNVIPAPLPMLPDRSTPSAAAARPAHQRHRPLQLPLRLLHAAGGLRPGPRLPAPSRAADLRRDRPAGRLFVAYGVEKVRLTGGEPLRATRARPSWSASSRRLPGVRDLTLTTNGVAPGAQAAGAARGRPAAGHRQPGRARRRDLHAHERRRRAGRQGAGRDRGGGGGRPRADQAEHGRQARQERARDPADGAALPGHAARILRFIEYMDVGHSNGWRLDESCPRPRSSPPSRPRCRWSR